MNPFLVNAPKESVSWHYLQHQVQQYKKQIEQYKKEINKYNDRVLRYQQTMYNHQKKIKVLEREIDHYRHELKESTTFFETQIQNLEAVVKLLNDTVDELCTNEDQ